MASGGIQKKHIIILGGPPGGGKSTLRGILAKRLGYKMFSTGDFVRGLAVERGMTLEALNEHIATNKELDLLIDKELERIEAEDDCYVVDSHLAFHFIPSGFSVFLNVSLETSARRIFEDKGALLRQKSGDIMETYAEALVRTKKRIENHRDRYMRHYGIDPYVPAEYDYVIETEGHTPEEISDMIQRGYEDWLGSHVVH